MKFCIFAAISNKLNGSNKNESKLNNNSVDKNISSAQNNSLLFNDIKQIDKINSINNSSNKLVNIQPYPINLKIEKLDNNTAVVTWDVPPNTDNSKQNIDLPEQLIVNYQFYLNHELHSLIKPNQKRSIVIDSIDFNKVFIGLLIAKI